MGKKFILSIDLGTTGNRIFCFDEQGGVLASSYREFTQYFPRPGWVEHDADEIWQAITGLIPEALTRGDLDAKNCIGIGITNQRETTVLWHRDTGKPLHHAIVWQCRRTTPLCDELIQAGHRELFARKTGLVIDAYFSGTKIAWLLRNVAGAMELAHEGKLLFGTIDTWILWKLTGGKVHATDYTNASRTLIFNIDEKVWDRELCDILGIPMNILPSVAPSAHRFGVTHNVPGIPNGTLIGGIAGDQQAAMVGQNRVEPGTSKNTYGTGCFMLLNSGTVRPLSRKGLLTTLACDNGGKPVYALEGSVFIGGAVMQWLRDYLEFFHDAASTSHTSMSIPDNDEVVVIPAFVGLGAPYWDMSARGAIFGLTRDTTRDQITRAALKSIAHQSMDVLKAMEEDTGHKIAELRVDGGATANAYLMQFQADILGIPVELPAITESTALGAAYLAGLTGGVYKTIDEIARYNVVSNRFTPVMEEQERKRQRRLWKLAISRLTADIPMEEL